MTKHFQNMKSPQPLQRAFWAFCLMFGVSGVFFCQTKLLVNNSPSLPYRYFLHIRFLKPQKGSITVYPTSRSSKKIELIKIIEGVEGDDVRYGQDGSLWINQILIGKPLSHDSKGKALQPIQPQVIAKGFVFLRGTHPYSLDSRYADIGLVKISELQGVAIPLSRICP